MRVFFWKKMRFPAILKGLCPRCLEGKVFSGPLKMHTHCPQCGIVYEREHGFFLMSIFFGYVIDFLLVLPLVIALYLLRAPLWAYLVGVLIILIPLAPLVFRYARILWLHLDELLDPRP